jgi:hypothetical protein
MLDAVRVAVPGDLARELLREGLSEVKRVRGADAQMILTIAETTVGLTANLATILVAKDEIGAFIQALRRWMADSTGRESGSEFTLEASRHDTHAEVKVRITSRRDDASQPPGVDVAAVESLVRAIFTDPAAPESSPPDISQPAASRQDRA